MTDVTPTSQPTLPTIPPVVPKPRRKRWPMFLAIGFVVVILFSGVGFVTASTLEDHDSFCIACHTVPETTYYNRAYMSLDNPTDKVTDLATDHYHLMQAKEQSFTCISCHRGDSGLGNRISAIALGARDSALWALGKEDPTISKTNISEGWLANAACISCHTDTLLRLDGITNHFHTKLPAAADALAKGGKLTVADASKGQSTVLLSQGLGTVNDVSLDCTSCHQPHQAFANGQTSIKISDVAPQCITCHKAAGKGPQDASTLSG